MRSSNRCLPRVTASRTTNVPRVGSTAVTAARGTAVRTSRASARTPRASARLRSPPRVAPAGDGRGPVGQLDWEFSVSGVTAEAAAGAWRYALGALLLERGAAGRGDGWWLLTADLDRTVGSSLWGASIYSYGGFGGPTAGRGEAVRSSRGLWAGGRGHVEHGGGSTGGFFILNSGEVPVLGWTRFGWSAKVATTLPAGGGAVRLQWLYATGGHADDPARSGEFRTIAQSVRDDLGTQSYWSLLGLTSPRGASDVNDLGIGLQNGGTRPDDASGRLRTPAGRPLDGVLRRRLAALGRAAPAERLDGHRRRAAGGSALADGFDDGPRGRCLGAAGRRLLQAGSGRPSPRNAVRAV